MTSLAPREMWYRRAWWSAALSASLVVTLLDAALLQRKNNYFTGGFLSVDHLSGPAQVVVFLAGLFITNLGVTGPLAALTLWLGRTWRRSTMSRWLLATSVAAIPLTLADIVRFRILAYLGSAFDFALLFDLAGRSPREILAVSSAHVLRFALLAGPVLGLFGALVVVVDVLWPLGRRGAPPDAGVWRWWFKASVTVIAVALVVSTGLRLTSGRMDNGFKRTPAGDLFGYLMDRLTDLDRDGYGLLGTPRDPAPLDARVYPWAIDYPGNGIDENGLAGDLPGGTPAYTEREDGPPQFARRPHVILVVLESFRADVVGSTLDGKPVTPTLDALARAGVSSRHAYSHNGYTVHSRFHLFSGSLANMRGQTSLIDDFKSNGYQVAYFSGQDETFGGADLDVGYERADVFYDARVDRDKRYSRYATPGSLAVPATVVRDRIRQFLAARADDRPLFLYVNFHDTHFPYHHDGVEPLLSESRLAQADIAPGRSGDLRRMYLNTAANVDREVGRVIADVTEALGTDPAVIVTADHGESLYDEGFLGHGYALNEAQTRIPLVVARLPLEVPEPFGQADLRDAIRKAMTAEGEPRPVLVSRPDDRPLLQYLGRLERPSALRVQWNDRSAGVDLRESASDRRIAGTCGAGVAASPATDRCRAIQFWERVVLAKATQQARASGP